jgi:hypothetical protein
MNGLIYVGNGSCDYTALVLVAPVFSEAMVLVFVFCVALLSVWSTAVLGYNARFRYPFVRLRVDGRKTVHD